jgi:hypothetical protein
MTTKSHSFAQVRMIWAIQLCFALICVLVSEYLRSPFTGLNWHHWVVAGLAVWSAAGGYSIRRKLVGRAVGTATSGNSYRAAKQWSAGEVYGAASATGVVLWGVVANLVLGSPRWFDALFYVVGFALLLAYRPAKLTFVA